MKTFVRRQPTLNPHQQQVLRAAVLSATALKASADAGPFARRAVTNTLPRPALSHKAATAFCKRGALFFYDDANKTGAGKNFRHPTLAWLSLALMVLKPDLEQRSKITRKDARPYTAMLNELSKSFTESGAAALCSVRKMDNSFECTVPFALLPLPSNYVNALTQLLGKDGIGATPDESQDYPAVMPVIGDDGVQYPAQFSVSRLSPRNGMFTNKAVEHLKSIPGAVITTRRFKGRIVFLLTLRFSKAECEFMTNSNWLEIRPLDMYGMIRNWSDSRLGALGRPPRTALNLQVIAETIPDSVSPITSKDYSILVDENSDYWWVPPATKDILTYESEMSSAYQQDDGTFSAYDGKGEAFLKGPRARIVLADWANLKLSYADRSGKLQVKSLDRAITPSATHYRRLLDLKLNSSTSLNLISLMAAMGLHLRYLSEPLAVGDLATYVLQEASERSSIVDGLMADDLQVVSLQDLRKVSDLADAVVSLAEKLVADSVDKDRLSNLYTEFSVPSVSQVMAFALVLVNLGSKYSTLVAEDHESRKVYANQDVPLPPDYEPQAVPYMSADRGMMPHQRRVSGKLAPSPDFAILPVAAGGGKTMTAVFDILKELGNGTSNRFLVMCPSHLVGQYVKEFVYFTDGRLNVIAVNAYTLKRHGIDGLAKMLSSAPVNTVVVTDYNIALGESRSFRTGYGTAVTRVYPVVEMLRSFMFNYVFLDESHYLKGTTGRQAAVARLVTSIKKKRLASGTLTPDSLLDLVKQVSLLDPTIFGSRSDFIEKYALETRGDKVTKWRPTAARDIMAQLKSSAVWAPAKRKEWAACLPTLIEEGITVQMTPKQQLVYKTVLESVVATIQEEMKTNKALQKALSAGSDAEETSDEDDEDDGPVDLDQLLKPFLQRLEQFVTAPAADELGGRMLEGSDRVSPKVHAIIKIIRDHLASGIPGKILIFTNYTASAEAIYENLPLDLKAQFIHYKASEKAEHGARFETDPSKIGMVGVEQSMNTGLNLQFCSRLIRVDSVWTPGSLEQGNSRIGRPNIKVAETRTNVYINWVVMDRSIDITKMAYLFAKRVTIGLFEESGNPLYKDIEAPPLFSMTLDTIAESNERTSDMLSPYYQAYAAFKKAEGLDFAAYRRQHPEDLNADGKLKMTPLSRAPNLPGSALMYRVPYVPGMEIYKAEDLGLVRYDQLLQLDPDMLEGDDEEDDDDVPTVATDAGSSPEEQKQARRAASRAASRAELEKVQHLSVHCEYGDCEIVSVSRKALLVRDATGSTHKINKLTAFVITRAQTNHEDMRTLVLKQTGDIPFEVPAEVKVKKARSVALPSGKAAKTADSNVISVHLDMVVLNDFIGLELNGVDNNPSGARAMQGLGFKQPPAYAYAVLPTAEHMFKQFSKWHEAGFTFHKDYNTACKNLYLALKAARKNAKTYVGFATQAALQNFFRMHIKPVNDPKLLCPYPMVWNDELYLCLPLTAHPASLKAMAVKAPGILWHKAAVEETLSVFMPSLTSFDRNMKALLETGIVVSNLPDLIKIRRRLQKRNPALLKGLQRK